MAEESARRCFLTSQRKADETPNAVASALAEPYWVTRFSIKAKMTASLYSPGSSFVRRLTEYTFLSQGQNCRRVFS